MVMAIETLFVKYIKLRNKLNNGKIYKITDDTINNAYIGSTCGSLKKRLSVHKCHYKMLLKGLYGNTKSFDIIKNNDYSIKLLEDCDVKTKEELLAKERYYIQNNECLNKVKYLEELINSIIMITKIKSIIVIKNIIMITKINSKHIEMVMKTKLMIIKKNITKQIKTN